MRSGFIGLLLATSALAQYAASDDGRIVYFVHEPFANLSGSRLTTWSEGMFRPLLDAAPGESLRLSALSTDGHLILLGFRTTNTLRWQLRRHGSATPVLDIADAATVSMSRNGRWLAIGRSSPTASVTRLEILLQMVRPAGVVTGSIVRGVGLLSTFDDGTVTFPCKESTYCAWDGATPTELPAFVGPGQNGQYLYYWTGQAPGTPYIQKLQQFDRVNNTSVELSAECPKRTVTQYAPSGRPDYIAHVIQSTAPLSDVSGRLVQFTCGNQGYLFDTLAATKTELPVDAVLNSTYTRILSRPTRDAFAWAPLGTAVAPLGVADSIRLFVNRVPSGVISTMSAPDLAISWGGQQLTWLQGAHGYSYAPLPADLVPAAVDSVAITSAARPWLNATVRMTVLPSYPGSIPLVAADPKIVFIHGDYRGFLTPTTPITKVGDYLHFLISGVDPDEVTPAEELQASFPNPSSAYRPPITFSLPFVALARTQYHPNISQVTVRIPADMRRSPDGNVTCTLQMVTRDGRTVSVSFNGYL